MLVTSARTRSSVLTAARRIRRSDGTISRTAAAVLLGLAAVSVPAATIVGCSDDVERRTGGDDDDNGDGDATGGGAAPAYGVPETSSGVGGAGASGCSSGDGGAGLRDAGATGGNGDGGATGQGGGPAPAYGVAATGGGT